MRFIGEVDLKIASDAEGSLQAKIDSAHKSFSKKTETG